MKRSSMLENLVLLMLGYITIRLDSSSKSLCLQLSNSKFYQSLSVSRSRSAEQRMNQGDIRENQEFF